MGLTSRGRRPAGPRLAGTRAGAGTAPAARAADGTRAAGMAYGTRAAGMAYGTRAAGTPGGIGTGRGAVTADVAAPGAPGCAGGVPPGSAGGVPPGCAGGVPPASAGGVPPGPLPGRTPARRKHRRPRLAPLALAGRPGVVAVGIGLVLAGSGMAGLLMASHSGYVPPRVAPARPVLAPAGRPQTPVPGTSAHVSAPISLTIPSIGVRTHLIHLGITKSGVLQVPAATTVAGWYTGSPRPGAIGSSVIVGHVDSRTGPGVFYRLHLLHPRNLIYVRQHDGRLAVFRVNSVHQYTKRGFPTVQVYGPVPTPQLRLITCGGAFDAQTGHYLSNIVVYATMTS